MRKTLYLKFILAYIIFGVFGFIMVATFVSNMTYEQLKREKSEQLYNEATLIANTYAADLYNSTTSLDTVKKQLDARRFYGRPRDCVKQQRDARRFIGRPRDCVK